LSQYVNGFLQTRYEHFHENQTEGRF